MNSGKLDELVECYCRLQPESVEILMGFYAASAHFVDPFNDVRGIDAIRRIFVEMFETLDKPRFSVFAVCRGEVDATIRWQMDFRRRGVAFRIQGCSWLVFDPNGQVCRHEDYWDPAKALFMDIPLLGSVLAWLYRRLSAG